MSNPKPKWTADITDETLEILAAIEHERWSAWHKHASSHWTNQNLERWRRQSETPYSELSESEKESDRHEVRKYYPHIVSSTTELARLREVEKIAFELLNVSEEALDRLKIGNQNFFSAFIEGGIKRAQKVLKGKPDEQAGS